MQTAHKCKEANPVIFRAAQLGTRRTAVKLLIAVCVALGAMVPPTAVHDAPWAHPTRRRIDLSLPQTRGGKFVTLMLLLIILYGVLLQTGMRTGRFGFIPISGNSMSSVLPQGSHVFVVPWGARDGDFVVAQVKGTWDTDDTRDTEPSLVAKVLNQGWLTSTDAPSAYDSFEVRGKIVAVLPCQKVLTWTKSDEVQTAGRDIPKDERVAACNIRDMERSLATTTKAHKLEGATRLDVAKITVPSSSKASGLDLGETTNWNLVVQGRVSGAELKQIQGSVDGVNWTPIDLEATVGKFHGRFIRFERPANMAGGVSAAWAKKRG